MDQNQMPAPMEISLERVLSKGIPGTLSYRNDFFITSNLREMETFRHPVRLRATTIFICISGEIDCMVNLKHYHITGNHIMINFSGDIIQTLGRSDLDGYCVILSNDYLHSLHVDMRMRTDGLLSLLSNRLVYVPEAELQYLMPYYVLIKKNIKEDNDDVIRSLARALSYQMFSLMRSYGNLPSDGGAMTRPQQIFEKFMNLLETYHEKERSLQFYAEKMYLTPKYVSGMVKQYTGKGALEWINEYVMLEAKMLLKYSDLTIQEVAYRLNFPTQSAFGKYFRQQEGVSPRAYRQGKEEKVPGNEANADNAVPEGGRRYGRI